MLPKSFVFIQTKYAKKDFDLSNGFLSKVFSYIMQV